MNDAFKERTKFAPGKILQSIDNEEIVVIVDGKTKSMAKAEAIFRQLFKEAIRGDLGAAKRIATMAAKYLAPEAEGPSQAEFAVMPDKYFDPGTSPAERKKIWKECRNSPQNIGLSKGRSGKAPRQVSISFLFRKVANEQVAVRLGGKKIIMSYGEE